MSVRANLPRIVAWPLSLALLVVTPHAFAESAPAPEGLATTKQILASAFEKRFDFDVVQRVVIETTQRRSTVSRELQMASKRIDGRMHGLAYIVEPSRLRDTRLLMIENFDRSDDFFIYLPSEDKVRRVTSSQRADRFMGTGLSYEDLERRYVADYEIADAGMDEIAGEKVHVIEARPRYQSGHDVALYFIAVSDRAILEVRYYHGDKKRLLRVQHVPRAGLIQRGGHLIPSRIEVEDRRARSSTRVTFSDIQLDPVLDDKLFTRSALELGRPIPYLRSVAKAAAVQSGD